MSVVTLGELLAVRDESLRSERIRSAWLVTLRRRITRSLVMARSQRASLARVGAMVASVLLALAGFLARHGLVLAGLASFVVAAALASTMAALVVAGVSLLFLEVRRR
jgi:preprotein translocase subunit SecF